ncbi:MAG: hypothetical protein Q9192_001278 [Flavoplaca navasiana]
MDRERASVLQDLKKNQSRASRRTKERLNKKSANTRSGTVYNQNGFMITHGGKVSNKANFGKYPEEDSPTSHKKRRISNVKSDNPKSPLEGSSDEDSYYKPTSSSEEEGSEDSEQGVKLSASGSGNKHDSKIHVDATTYSHTKEQSTAHVAKRQRTAFLRDTISSDELQAGPEAPLLRIRQAVTTELDLDQNGIQNELPGANEGVQDDNGENQRINLESIQVAMGKMKNKWSLSAGGAVVEDKIRQRLEDDLRNIPYLIAYHFICDIDDPVWVDDGFFTLTQMTEIRNTNLPIELKPDHLSGVENEFEEILKGLTLTGFTDGSPMDIAILRDKYDTFMADNKGKRFRRELLEWMHAGLSNFIWFCEKKATTIGPPEISYAFDIWNITRDRAPIPGTTLWRLRRRVGCKVDGILFDNATRVEYLIILAAKDQVGANDDAKSKQDFHDLAKTMNKVLRDLHSRVCHKPEIISRMRLCGILEHGRQWSVLVAQMTKGHVTVLRKNPMHPYPDSVNNFEEWAAVMKDVMAVRQEIQTLIRLVKQNSTLPTFEGPQQPSCVLLPTPVKDKDPKPKNMK